MRMMGCRALVLGLAIAVVAPLAASSADAAVVICQKKNKLKLRIDACTAKETQVDAAELGVTGPVGPEGPQGPAGAPATNLWAVVEGDGTLVRGSGVASAALPDPPGGYEVIFNQDVTGCAYVASLGLTGSAGIPNHGSIGVVGRISSANGVYVITRDGAGSTASSPFHLAVFCP